VFLRAELRRRRRRLAGDESGFTLLEVVVALMVLAIAAAGTVTVLATGSHAAAASVFDTQGKDLTQQRIESMRVLPFHVDRQNGPYIDLLDLYYTNLSTTPTTRTRGAITDTSGATPPVQETQTVRWFASGSAPDPTNGPFYQVSVSSIPDYPGFSQVIDSQFLDASGNPLPASVFQSGGTFSNYDSQTEGQDSPPTLLLGVTVITSWTKDGVSKSYSTTTRITDTHGTTTFISSQGVGEYLRVISNGPNGGSTNFDALAVDYLRAEADGSQTTGSSATADLNAFEATDSGQGQDAEGATGDSSSPGSTSVTSPVVPTQATEPLGVPGCGWATVGVTQVSDVTTSTSTSTTNGLPQVPSDVGTNQTTPAAMTSASQPSNGQGSCRSGWNGLFGFDNQSSSYLSSLSLTPGNPLVYLQNPSGGATATSGSAWVNASTAVTTPHWVSSGGAIATATSTGNAACPLTTSGSSTTVACVELFPGLSFVNDGGGLVDVAISSASLTCTANVPSGGGNPTYSATSSVTGAVSYWSYNGGSPKRVVIPLNSTLNGGTDPLAAVLASNPLVSSTKHLGDYIATWSSTQSVLQDTNNGLFQVPGVVNITTVPVRSSDPTSAVGVEVGALACVAADNR
jgi:prepilin-type N-terminal cleavage/methylation domain-containing protein